jgi:hypothetical protein
VRLATVERDRSVYSLIKRTWDVDLDHNNNNNNNNVFMMKWSQERAVGKQQFSVNGADARKLCSIPIFLSNRHFRLWRAFYITGTKTQKVNRV